MAIAFVKEVLHNAGIANPGATAAVSVTAAPGAGNLLILSVALNSTVTLSSVTDDKGNLWTVDKVASNPATSQTVAIASTEQDVGVPTTITLHFSASLTARAAVAVHEFSGATKTVDQSAAGSGSTGTARDAGTMSATTNADDLIWAAFALVAAETSFTPGAGYSTPTTAFYANSTVDSVEFEYQIVSATGTYGAAATGGRAARSIGAMVAYKAASSGVTNNDSPSGTISLSGSLAESHTVSDSVSGTITLSGSDTDAYGHISSDSPTGTITLSGSLVESHSTSSSPSGTIALTGSRAESRGYQDAPAGTISLAGSLTRSTTFSDSPEGSLSLDGSIAESYTTPGGFTLSPAAGATILLDPSPGGVGTLTGASTDSPPLNPASGDGVTLTPVT